MDPLLFCSSQWCGESCSPHVPTNMTNSQRSALTWITFHVQKVLTSEFHLLNLYFIVNRPCAKKLDIVKKKMISSHHWIQEWLRCIISVFCENGCTRVLFHYFYCVGNHVPSFHLLATIHNPERINIGRNRSYSSILLSFSIGASFFFMSTNKGDIQRNFCQMEHPAVLGLTL